VKVLTPTTVAAESPLQDMPAMKTRTLSALVLTLLTTANAARAQHGAQYVRPDAIADLRAVDGTTIVQAEWRFAPARIVDVDHHAAGPDLKPTGAPNRTHDITPEAGAADFDDSAWEKLDPTTLDARRGTGRLSFAWYRTSVTIPESIGGMSTAGATIVFEVVVDDYAEVWIDGNLPQVIGQSGGPLAKGWNAPNRVVLTRNAQAGQRFQLAVFGANAPLSRPPGNFIWVRSATLDFYKPGRFAAGVEVPVKITKFDDRLDGVIDPGTRAERVADGFGFTEGPVWVRVDPKTGVAGHLLFSDPNNNTIYRYSPDDGEVSVFRTKSGYTGADIGLYGQPGSNGLALDPQGRLTVNEHGNRRVTRIEPNGVVTVLADRYEGKRLNSPNDLCYRSDGTLYFTDPPYGLPKFHADPRRELNVTGVFCLPPGGALRLLSTELTGPNGIGFSPNENFLYVSNWDEHRKVVLRYDVAADGSLGAPTTFLDLTAETGEEALDGLKVDLVTGNVLVSGPGGLWVVAPDGKRLGLLKLPQQPANFVFGDADGRTVYVTARTAVYRFRLKQSAGLDAQPAAFAPGRVPTAR
jgi:gluconolactonase